VIIITVVVIVVIIIIIVIVIVIVIVIITAAVVVVVVMIMNDNHAMLLYHTDDPPSVALVVTFHMFVAHVLHVSHSNGPTRGLGEDMKFVRHLRPNHHKQAFARLARLLEMAMKREREIQNQIQEHHRNIIHHQRGIHRDPQRWAPLFR
jgi:hypothetical protein